MHEPEGLEAPRHVRESPPAQPERHLEVHESWREHLVTSMIERILADGPTVDEAGALEEYGGMPVREQVDALYRKLLSARTGLAALRSKLHVDHTHPLVPLDPFVLDEIRALWANPQVQTQFIRRYTEGWAELDSYRLSELGTSWRSLGLKRAEKER